MAEVIGNYEGELHAFASDFKSKAIYYREEPFKLKSGLESQWYVDTRVGLADGKMLRRAGALMLETSIQLGLGHRIIAGCGVGGRMFPTAMMYAAAKRGMSICAVWANDNAEDADPLNGGGLHGEPVGSQRVLPVDDIAMRGTSTIELVGMLREAGATVTDTLYLTDRSGGLAAEALGEIDVAMHSIFEFDENSGLLTPDAR